MTVAEFKSSLSRHPDLNLRFQLPDDRSIPAHAHVSEVARVDKRFIDCGGTLRTETVCRLQLWVAKDFWHRLNAGKFLAILTKAEGVLGSDEMQVDVEYDCEGQLTLSLMQTMTVVGNELVVKLQSRQTECLAKRHKLARNSGLRRWWNAFVRR